MATMYYDDAADLAIIRGKKVAILGYGSQGHAHALNLRDSGVEVRVGLPATSRSRAKAEAAGLTVGEVGDVTRWADVVMVLVPDTTAAELYRDQIGPNLAAGKLLLFAHGFNIRFGAITVRPDVDVAMVAPKAPGPPRPRALRRRGGHAGADRDSSGRDRAGAGRDAVVRQGHRRDARGRHRNDVCRRDRDGSLRRAGGALRRRQRADQGGLRNARRGRAISRRSRTSNASTS